MSYAPTPPPVGYPAPPPPGFPAASAQHPVQLSIEHQASYSRGLGCLGALFFLGRAILALPVLIVVGILFYIAAIVGWIMEIVVVLSGHYPKGVHGFVTGVLRLYVRSYAWILGLTDRYPGFGLGA
jgi:hypothetical protein